MEIRLTHNGSTFAFTRNWNGEGAWYCVSGRCPGIIGSRHNIGVMVPLFYASNLTEIAVSTGVANHSQLSRFVKVEKKESVRVRGTKSRRNTPRLKGAFNPFKAVSATGDVSDAEEVIEKVIKNRKSKRTSDDEETVSLFSDLFQPDLDEDDFEDIEETPDELEYEEITSETIG